MDRCDNCKQDLGDDFVRCLISEGMGVDDTGAQVESGVSEHLFCSTTCLSKYYEGWAR